jgi:aminodeoxyfutalosine deaminase
MMIRARTVVTMDGAPVENGAVVVSKNRIVDVGRYNDLKTHNSGNAIDLGDQVLLPGLINTHCHLDYTCLRGKIPTQKSFTDWVRAINAEKSELSPKDYVASIRHGFEEAKRFGTTAVANLTAFPELIPQIRPPIRSCWFAELIDIRAPERAIDQVESAIESLSRARSRSAPWGLAPHALFTASKDLFRRCAEIAAQNDTLLTTHLAESSEEMEMFHDASGPLYDFIKSIGRPMNDCGNETPLRLFLGTIDQRALPRWIVAHLNEFADSDFDLLERPGQKFHVAHCPRSHQFFRRDRFAFERLRALGFNVCLGTDSLASNDNLSLFAEMRAFQTAFPSISAEEILRMATVNSARALGQENALGSICSGAVADLIALPLSGRNLFEEIVAFTGEPWMMIGGRVQ